MKKKGFTLVELLAVIVLLAIILAIAVPSISGVIDTSTRKAFESDAKMILKAIDYKKLESKNFDVLTINKDNIEDLLGLSNVNYDSVNVITKDKSNFITVVGTNKWNDLVACGTYNNMMVVNEISDCSDDAIAPVITILGDNPVSIFIDETYSDAGATAMDDRDGDITSKIVVTGTINPSIPGSYTITYTVTDITGNQASSSRTVNVIDNVEPTVTFNPNGNSIYAKSRTTKVDVADIGGINGDSLKYVWTASSDEPSSDSFTNTYTSGQDISTPSGVTGGHYLWVEASDIAGNNSIIRSNVFNLDNTKPIITLNGSNPVNINVGSTYSDAGATATDADSGVSGSVTSIGSVNPSVVGIYTITYNVSDNAGNTATAVTRTVNVLDNIAPTVSFGTNGNSTYAKSRSTTVTVSDNISVNTSSLKYLWNTSTTAPSEASFSTTFTNGGTITSPSVTGSYYLWILAKDNIGNTKIQRTNAFNLDNTKPIITLNGSNLVNINVGSTYSDAGATATDAHSGISGSVVATGTVNTSAVGTYTVTYNVSDNAGNAATTVTRTVIVQQLSFAFNYTGNVQTFTAPMTGTYQLEVWGAQGGGYVGGLGGYSKGNKYLTAGQTLQVNVGGQGDATTSTVAPHNQSVVNVSVGNGGGATDISSNYKRYTSSDFSTLNGSDVLPLGTLSAGSYQIIMIGNYSWLYDYNYVAVYSGSSLMQYAGSGAQRCSVNSSAICLSATLQIAASYTDVKLMFLYTSGSAIIRAGFNSIEIHSLSTEDRYIVAGGGGGSGYGYESATTGIYLVENFKGGDGGGESGQSGTTGSDVGQTYVIATQTSGFTRRYGEVSAGGGGGDGYYGGGGGKMYSGQMGNWSEYGYASGAGGSGYIGGVSNGTTTPGVRSGNGYALITYIGQ